MSDRRGWTAEVADSNRSAEDLLRETAGAGAAAAAEATAAV